MSLAIDIDRVTSVLLTDGWHSVADVSFDLDAYEYVSTEHYGTEDEPMIVHGGGNSGLCATGFSFLDTDHVRFSGPLTSIIAVQHRRR